MKSLSYTSPAGRTAGGEHATAASTNPTIGFGRPISPSLRQFVAAGDGGGIDAMMERVTDLLNEETKLLRAHNIDQLALFTERKGQALLELTRLLRSDSPLRGDHSMAAQLERLRGAIAANQRTLKCHVEATAELSRILTRAMEDDMSDGTYSVAICRRGLREMIRVVTAGLWVAILLVATSMVALELKVFSDSAEVSESAKFPVETSISDMISVPIVTEKGIDGYVLARFAVAHRAGALGQLGSKLQDIVADEAFRAIYKSLAVDFANAKKADLASLTNEIAAGMGKRIGPEIVSEVLIKEFTFVSKQDARR